MFLVFSEGGEALGGQRLHCRTNWLTGWTRPTTRDKIQLYADPLPFWEPGARVLVAIPDRSATAVGGDVFTRQVILTDEVTPGWPLLGAFPRASAFVALSCQSAGSYVGYHLDFSFADFSQTTLASVDLRGRELEGANFDDCDIQQGNFVESRLKGARFKGARLRNADFTRADLRGANFHRANLRGANFDGADLAGAWLEDTDLIEADFFEAKLSGAHLDRARLHGVGLVRAQLGQASWPPGSALPSGWELDEQGRLRRAPTNS